MSAAVRPRILLVDDQPANFSALEALLAGSFAAVLLVVRVPALDALLTAGGADTFPVERAYALGKVDHLAEPFDARVLCARIKQWLTFHRQEAELARLRLILENLHDYAFIGTDTGRRITEWEAGAEAITGCSAREACGQSAEVTLSHEAGFDQRLIRPVSRAALEQALATATEGRA